MKSIAMICVVLWLSNYVMCRPGVEVERQRIVQLPKSLARYSRPIKEPTPEETRRILDGIHQINVQLGYVKEAKSARLRPDADAYFYPRPPYQPEMLKKDYGALEAAQYARQLQYYAHPYESDTYFFPTPYLKLPTRHVAHRFQKSGRQLIFDYPASDYYTFVYNNNPTGRQASEMNQEKSLLVRTVQKIVHDMQDSTGYSRQLDQAVVVPTHRRKVSKNSTKSKNANKKLAQTSIIVVSPMTNGGRAEADSPESKTIFKTTRPKATSAAPAKQSQPPQQNPNLLPSQVTPAPTAKPSFLSSLVPTSFQRQPTPVKVDTIEDEYEDQEAVVPEKSFKGPFSSYFENQKEQVVEALKQGGVIIQRLRVREGGIAIAGPNGVATAGSGGTAIVGPGGIALTHPRSLSIAGPGARVVAVPESTDLQELALRSDGRSIPAEGVLVATGPVVYWNPDTKSP